MLILTIESFTTKRMINNAAATTYTSHLCQAIERKTATLGKDSCRVELALAGSVSKLNEDLLDGCTALKTALDTMPEGLSAEEEMRYCHDTLFAAMTRVRETIDHMETLVASDYWPVPTYSELLFSV